MFLANKTIIDSSPIRMFISTTSTSICYNVFSLLCFSIFVANLSNASKIDHSFLISLGIGISGQSCPGNSPYIKNNFLKLKPYVFLVKMENLFLKYLR